MDRVYFDGMDGLSYIEVNEDFHDSDEGWDTWDKFKKEYFSVYQYKDEEVVNYWGVGPSEFHHDKKLQSIYDELWVK